MKNRTRKRVWIKKVNPYKACIYGLCRDFLDVVGYDLGTKIHLIFSWTIFGKYFMTYKWISSFSTRSYEWILCGTSSWWCNVNVNEKVYHLAAKKFTSFDYEKLYHVIANKFTTCEFPFEFTTQPICKNSGLGLVFKQFSSFLLKTHPKCASSGLQP